MGFLKRFLLVLILGLILGGVVYFVEPPKSWLSATTYQILGFFIPLLFFYTSLVNLFLNYLARSFTLGLGFLLLTVFYTTGLLTLTTGILIFSATVLLFSFLPNKHKRKNPRSIFTRMKQSLTREPKIPKLSRLGDKSDE